MKTIFTFILLSFCCVVNAQLIVDNTTQTPVQLVQNMLSSSGLIATNIKFNGSLATANIICDQAAEFSTGFTPTNLILDHGVLLTTGNAIVAVGPNNDEGLSNPSENAIQGDVDLELLTIETVNEVAVLEFDFVATGTIFSFKFVFGSEEYPEFVNTEYNDVLGIFLSGPGITGTFSGNAKNIAFIPNTTIPFSINAVNNGFNNDGVVLSGQFPSFYYNNSTIGLYPNLNLDTPVQYDGFTKPLSVQTDLQLGATYHIKFAIANVADDFYDSGVFITNFNISPLGIDKKKVDSKFSIYPNPSNDIVTISNPSKLLITSINITDTNGRIVETIKQDYLSDSILTISKLKSGIYFLEIISNGTKTIQKIIKN
jgi:Secretion system C-terminal sorting domain